MAATQVMFMRAHDSCPTLPYPTLSRRMGQKPKWVLSGEVLLIGLVSFFNK